MPGFRVALYDGGDDANAPVVGARVSLGGTVYVTDDEGVAVFPDRDPTLTMQLLVEATGFELDPRRVFPAAEGGLRCYLKRVTPWQ